ncbi:MAG TPA: 2-dehydropantoate 2-reductase [Steroidobacteraceae bacterium]
MPPGEYEFVVLGAGAIGSILGAHLARAGHSVAMLARGRRAEQVQAQGLKITGLVELVTPVVTLTAAQDLRAARTLIVAMKTPGTADALAALRPAHIDVALSIQNGPMKNELLGEVFGEQRVLGALADTSGELLADGEVVFTRNVNILLGELSGEISERVQRIASDIDASGVRCTAVSRIRTLEWSKFTAWVGLAALAVATRAVTWRYLTDPGAALVLVRIVREMGRLAHALGIELTDESVLPVVTICSGGEDDAVAAVLKVGREYESRAPRHRLSALQDLEAGRRLEVHETLGYALRKAAQTGIPMPLVDGFYQVMAAVDRLR